MVIFACLRRRDDVPAKQECSFEANCKHIAKFAVKENVADTHPSVVTLAFGRGNAPKLVHTPPSHSRVGGVATSLDSVLCGRGVPPRCRESAATAPVQKGIATLVLTLPRPARQRRLLDDPDAEVDNSSGNTSFTSYIPQATTAHPTFEKHRCACVTLAAAQRPIPPPPLLLTHCPRLIRSEERRELVNVVRQKALYALIETLHDPINVGDAVANGAAFPNPNPKPRCAISFLRPLTTVLGQA